MHRYSLAEEFTDPAAERALLASLIHTPMLYWNLLDLLTPEVFPTEAATWQRVAQALELEQRPSVPADWPPAPDPHATAQRLLDLHQRRLLAVAQERLAQALFDETTPAPDIAGKCPEM